MASVKKSRIKNTCPEEWNPGTWPYVAKCVLEKGHKEKCVDRHHRERPEPMPYLGPDPVVGSWTLGHE